MAKIKHIIRQVKNGRIRELLQQYKWIYGYAKVNLPAIILFVLLGFSGTIISLFSSMVSRDLVDIITGHNTGVLVETFGIMIGTQLLGILVSQVSVYISTKLSIKVENYIKADVYDKIMTTEWEALSQFHSGDLMVRWAGDVSAVSNGILNLAPNLLIGIFRFVSALYVVVSADWTFALFAICSVPISYWTSKRNMSRMKSSNMQSMNVNSRMSSFAQESFSNYQTIKAFDMVGLYSKRLRSLQRDVADVRMKYQRVSAVNSTVLSLVSILVTYSTYGWGVYKVWNGSISYGTMTMFLTLSSTLSGTTQSLLNFIPNAVSVANAAKRIMRIMDLPKEDFGRVDEVAEYGKRNCTRGISLYVQDVAYQYAGGAEVFTDATFYAKPHETVALVGPSGQGKTTLLRMLLAIIKEKSGEAYLIAGEDCEHGERIGLSASTRQLFAYVPQGNTMFSGTIAENMRNVKEDATDEEIVQALKMACAWEFVEKLPEQIQSEIQERGGGLSEGQAQRLSIARALLRKSPILLLDEATSALDVETEKALLQNIMRDTYPRTTILTTHRPSVLKSCNRVYSVREQRCVLLDRTEIQKLMDL